jgi:hypothetical protein
MLIITPKYTIIHGCAGNKINPFVNFGCLLACRAAVKYQCYLKKCGWVNVTHKPAKNHCPCTIEEFSDTF